MTLRKSYLSFLLTAGILCLGLLISTNVSALRWIYKLFTPGHVIVGTVTVELPKNSFVLSRKDDSSLLLIGGFYTDSDLLPTESFLTVVKYDHLGNDSLERLKAACQKQGCEKFEIKDIMGARCAVVESSTGFLKMNQPLNIYCPFERSKLMIEYHGLAVYQPFFQVAMARLLEAASKT